MAKWTVTVGELGKVASVEGYPYEARREGLALMFEWGCKIHLTTEDLKRFGYGTGNGSLAEIGLGEPGLSGTPTFESPAGRAVFWQKFSEEDGIFEARVKLPPREFVPVAVPVIIPMLRGLVAEPSEAAIAETNRWIEEQNRKGEFGTLRITREMGLNCLWPDVDAKGEYERRFKFPALILILEGGKIRTAEILNEIFYQMEVGSLVGGDVRPGMIDRARKDRLYFYRDERDHDGKESHADWSYEELRSLLHKSAFDEQTMLSFCDLQARPLWIGWRKE